MNSTYDDDLKRDSLNTKDNTTVLDSMTFDYDEAGRLEKVSSDGYHATYGYLANSPLVETITFENGSSDRMITTKAYDRLNRLIGHLRLWSRLAAD